MERNDRKPEKVVENTVEAIPDFRAFGRRKGPIT